MITNYTEKLKQYINENEQISGFCQIIGSGIGFNMIIIIVLTYRCCKSNRLH